jgi:hypothetical protein
MNHRYKVIPKAEAVMLFYEHRLSKRLSITRYIIMKSDVCLLHHYAQQVIEKLKE